MKHEWKKHEKDLYTTAQQPTLVTVPRQQFIMISGQGNPNGPDFALRVGVLMSVAYPIKMRHKAYCQAHPEAAAQFPCGDYSVYPLEGLWSAQGNPLDKANLNYTIMVRQPDFITEAIVGEVMAQVTKKKPDPLLEAVRFGSMSEGLCVQMLHLGTYDDEPASFAQMDAFTKAQGLARVDHIHREIYFTDARKTSPDKYQTLLRYRVE